MDPRLPQIMKELEALGREDIKRIYMNHGAREPLFGVTTGDLKPVAKKYKKQYDLALELFDTGNYDATYLAGMITDPKKMTEEDFEHWLSQAYCSGISEWTVAVTLADSPLGLPLAARWVEREEDHAKAAGFMAYASMLGHLPDEAFDLPTLERLLDRCERTIHSETNRTKYTMNSFVMALGISYLPLHERAKAVADAIGYVEVDQGGTACKTALASEKIQIAVDRGRLGFKRKNVRC